MRLVTFKTRTTQPRVGIAISEGIIDISLHLPDAPRTMIDLIDAWPELKPSLQHLVHDCGLDMPFDAATLLAPVPRPGKIMAMGLNYADHVEESGLARPEHQMWFSKVSSAANGPYAPIELPLVSNQLDYEAELAFVIGKRCRHVSREDASKVIFGYCAANDVSIRDWQLRTSQFVVGKSFDTHAPFGPWIVTADELGDPHKLRVRCYVNGEKRQDSNTRQLIFDCYDEIAYLSQAMTLEPGDVILTGTPGGVGFGFKPPKLLVAGDVVRVEIERIGAIENKVVAESRSEYRG